MEIEFRQGQRRSIYRARLGHAAGDTLIFLDEVVGYDEGEHADSDVRIDVTVKGLTPLQVEKPTRAVQEILSEE